MSEVNADGVLLNPGEQLTRLVLHRTDVLAAGDTDGGDRRPHRPGEHGSCGRPCMQKKS